MNEEPAILPPWKGLTLPGLARSMGQFRKTDVFFRESGDTRAALGRPADTLTGSTLDARVQHFARQMISLGLKPGDRLALLCLPSTDLVVALIGAMAAGLTPVLLPLSMTLDRMIAVSDDAAVSGIVAGPDLDDMFVATVARNIAARSFRVRAIAGFGDSTPEGVVALDGWVEDELGVLPDSGTIGEPGLITVDQTGDTPVLYHRSQIQLIADALAFASTAQLKPRGTILQTLAVSSAFFVATGIVAPLLVRAETRFLPLFSSSAFTDMILNAGHNPVVVLPAHLEGHLVDAQRAFGDHVLTITFVHQAGTATRTAPVARLPNQRLMDSTLIGEAGTYSLARTLDGRRAFLPENWRQPGPSLLAAEALFLQARIASDGQLSLSGFGAAKPLGQANPPSILALSLGGQTFEITPRASGSLAA